MSDVLDLSSSGLVAAFAAGLEQLRIEHAAEELPKLGTLRGGSSGAVIGGQWFGKCGRLAHLRQVGLQVPAERSSLQMFEGGYASEVAVDKVLAAWLRTRPLGSVWLDRAAQLSYTLADGTSVTSRPDVVVRRTSDNAPVLVLELKMVASMWTALGVHYDLKPKSDHLIQLGHYCDQLKVPGVLMYTSWSDFHISTAPPFITSKFGPNVYDIEYRDDGKPLKIRPFVRAYDVAWGPSGKLEYGTDGFSAEEPMRESLLTAAAILEYYTRVADVQRTKQLPPRPTAKGVDGFKSYKACDYCPLAAVCDSSETNYSEWRDRVEVGIRSGELKD